MTEETLDPDFAALPAALRADIEGSAGIGLHHAPDAGGLAAPGFGAGASAAPAAGDPAFRHPETDAAGTEWEPNWEPIDTYPGGVVMIDDGDRQLLAMREDGTWSELSDGDMLPLTGFVPMLWSRVSDQVKFDLM